MTVAGPTGIPLGDGQMTSGPSAVMAADRLTVFARSADGTLTHKFYDSGWTDWIPLGEDSNLLTEYFLSFANRMHDRLSIAVISYTLSAALLDR